MRSLVVACALLSPCVAFAQERVLLVPLDSRPAAWQLPQWIGRIADVQVDIPPMPLLGRFTTPGNPDGIKEWLDGRDLTRGLGIIVSADMLAYGGLIASRVPEVSEERALANLTVLKALRQRNPKLPVYVFASLTRTAPTAHDGTRSFRVQLARFAELSERLERTSDSSLKYEINQLRSQIPKAELERYYAARKRNMAVHRALMRYVVEGVIDYLVIGADDAQAYGPHYPEWHTLRREANNANVGGKVFLCEGIDQQANVLLSRLLLRNAGWTPRVRVVPSDSTALTKRAAFESTPLGKSIDDQIIAAGGRPTSSASDADYTLFLNAPRANSPDTLLQQMLKDERSLAIADTNHLSGHADERLVKALQETGAASQLLGFAGWNTASNTVGTAVPQANVYLLAKRKEIDPLRREVAQRAFLLHRIVSDYGFHRYIRPVAYRMMDRDPNASREEAYGESFRDMQDWVVRNTRMLVDDMYHRQVAHSEFLVGDEAYRIARIANIRVELPWPRAFEALISFDIIPEKLGKGGSAAAAQEARLQVRH